MKDNFSNNSASYKQYRPTYPDALFDFIFECVSGFETAWDCATGSGQIAKDLATKFKNVYASDISAQQLANATKKTNIYFSEQSAEKTNFSESTFDLITVGQAVHWVNFEQFYAEANRTLKSNGIIAIIGYGKLQINIEIDKIITKLYTEILGKYWDIERKYVDENYKTIPFPFHEISCPSFSNKYSWTIEQLLGYFETWSAVKHYKDLVNENPLDLIRNELYVSWEKDCLKEISFPILTRIGSKI